MKTEKERQRTLICLRNYIATQESSACKITETKPSHLGSNSDLIICSKSKLCELIQLGNDYGPLCLVSFSRTGHVAQTVLKCHRQQSILTWNSSTEQFDDLVINYKIVHAYLCSCMLRCQYQKISNFADIGVTTEGFRAAAVPSYSRVVNVLKIESIKLNV